MTAKIALEEHFMTEEMRGYWEPSVVDFPAEGRSIVLRRLTDFGEERLASMDQAGVTHAILGLAGPGAQAEPDAALAQARARRANDELAEQVARNPARYSGFAHLAMHDPVAAADELERCVVQLGFKGAMINGQTLGRYLDGTEYDPFWARAADLNAPIYLHPADPQRPNPVLADYPELTRATWGWTVETASHALRIVFGGVFDRHPRARLILGHMGETLPFMLWRLDSRYKLYKPARPLKKLPSQYIRENIHITTSGQCSPEALACSLAALGKDRVMFSIDYPFESPDLASEFIEAAPLSDAVRQAVCHRTAAALFGIKTPE